MQRVQLDPVHACLNDFFQRLQAMLLPFSRQADNQMRADFQATFAGQAGGALISGKIMAAINTVQGFVMRALQA